MSSARAAGEIRHRADARTIAVLEEQGRQEALKDLETTGEGSPGTGHESAYKSTLVAALAEFAGDLAGRIAELEESKPAASSRSKTSKQ